MEQNDPCLNDTYILLNPKGNDLDIWVSSYGRKGKENYIQILGYWFYNLSLKFLGNCLGLKKKKDMGKKKKIRLYFDGKWNTSI